MLSGEEIIFSNIAPIISYLVQNSVPLRQYKFAMKPLFEQVRKSTAKSQLTQVILNLPEFEPYWHFHPEFELTFIISGSGKRIVGDSIDLFYSGDLVLLGPDLPHTWNSVENEDQKGKCQAVVFQFSERIIPGPAKEFPEFDTIRKLLDAARLGIFFSQEIAGPISKKLLRITKLSGLEKLCEFWQILDLLSITGHGRQVASANYIPLVNKYNGNRINSVFRHVSIHFSEDIRLSQVAELTHLTQTSFSRFFKMITGETFTDYLNDFRISKACSLLTESTGLSIQQIAIECGFRSSTHFNRMFFRKKGCSPGSYRQDHSLTVKPRQRI